MKKLILSLALLPLLVIAQNPSLKVNRYVLANGFTIYLNADKTAKDVFGAVIVKAGSKNDPADATGMAHYQEHLLFKGTTQFGTSDYQKEKPFLDSINIYYDMLGKTTNERERSRIQLLINNQSVQAAKYSLPTEFDKMIKSIGGTSMNAFTTEDNTVYYNAFPAEGMEKWLDLYSLRFQNPVFRSFQSELEVVYEEKNRSTDHFVGKLFEVVNQNMFKYHPYGTQTTIGTTAHLKNPSLTKMYDFFNTYYVPNNMALVLCGNFDEEKVLPIIKEKFGKLQRRVVPIFPKYPPTVFKQKEVVNVRYTPVKIAIFGYKTIPKVHPDKAALEVLQNLLTNRSETGRLDKLSRSGKILAAGCEAYSFNDDGAMMLFLAPKLIGQSFKKAESYMMAEVDKIKKGEILDTDLMVVKTGLYLERTREIENKESRTISIAETFSQGISWEDELNYIKQLEKVSKADVLRVANTYFGDNYFVLHSRTGFPKREFLKKPAYKPVVTDQKAESDYAKKFKETPEKTSEPKFLDFDKDATRTPLNNSNTLYVTPNPVNDIFTLNVEFKIGSDSLKNLDIAAQLSRYFHTQKLSTDQLKDAMAMLGLSYSMQCSESRFDIYFTGLETHFVQSLRLIDTLLQNVTADEQSLKQVVEEIKVERKEEVKIPDNLDQALFEYVRLGNKSPYLDRNSMDELKTLKAADLVARYKMAVSYNAVWHYVGTQSMDAVKDLITANITLSNKQMEMPLNARLNIATPETRIYIYEDKKAIQSHIHFLVNTDNYPTTPQLNANATAFNQYMGGGFSGLIVQEIREYRSLAYTAYGSFVTPVYPNNPAYFYSYLGCQADKTNEAFEVMDSLIRFMPQRPERMEGIRSMMKKNISAYYPDFRYISSSIDYYRQIGYNSLPLKAKYVYYNALQFEDVLNFYNRFVKNRTVVVSIYGNTSKMDLNKLSKYGKLVVVKEDDILKK